MKLFSVRLIKEIYVDIEARDINVAIKRVHQKIKSDEYVEEFKKIHVRRVGIDEMKDKGNLKFFDCR